MCIIKSIKIIVITAIIIYSPLNKVLYFIIFSSFLIISEFTIINHPHTHNHNHLHHHHHHLLLLLIDVFLHLQQIEIVH
jgi:predicted CDP-diglyceride synthetase/phosphatidate cytidylyltransferase